jgi:hypothetical protein
MSLGRVTLAPFATTAMLMVFSLSKTVLHRIYEGYRLHPPIDEVVVLSLRLVRTQAVALVPVLLASSARSISSPYPPPSSRA